MMPILKIERLSKRFHGLHANSDIDFQLDEGQVRCIIGPNGAGKSTLISMISGHLEPTSGKIFYRGNDITQLSIIQRARQGIGRKFQTPSLFDGLSAYRNLELAALSTHLSRSAREALIAQIVELIHLQERVDVPANHLSHGQRQWLEIGLLLAVQSKLLLLDEPGAGMTDAETRATAHLINQLSHERGLSTIVIEHDMNFVRELAASVTVLHLGRILREGTYAEIVDDKTVRDVYLGYQ